MLRFCVLFCLLVMVVVNMHSVAQPPSRARLVGVMGAGPAALIVSLELVRSGNHVLLMTTPDPAGHDSQMRIRGHFQQHQDLDEQYMKRHDLDTKPIRDQLVNDSVLVVSRLYPVAYEKGVLYLNLTSMRMDAVVLTDERFRNAVAEKSVAEFDLMDDYSIGANNAVYILSSEPADIVPATLLITQSINRRTPAPDGVDLRHVRYYYQDKKVLF